MAENIPEDGDSDQAHYDDDRTAMALDRSAVSSRSDLDFPLDTPNAKPRYSGGCAPRSRFCKFGDSFFITARVEHAKIIVLV